MDALKTIAAASVKETTPEFSVGDTVKVSVNIREGERERIQMFEGTVIAKRGSGVAETFTVRRVAYGVGVERVFPLHSPNVKDVQVVRYGKVRRSKLYYLRDRVGKAAKVKEQIRKYFTKSNGTFKSPFFYYFSLQQVTKLKKSKNNVNEANMAVLQPEGVNDSSDINPEMYVDKKPSISEKQFLVAKEEGAMSGFYDWVRCILFAISVVVVCLIFLFRLVDVEGRSMNNTLATNDKVIVTNLFYTPQNNDIVVISHGAEYNSPIIKRVIAVAGQSVKVDQATDQILVDGVVLDEPYIEGSTYGNNIGDNEIPEVIPEGKIFVMGDNRKDSMDSRSTKIGLIDVDDVIGKAQFVVYPFDHFGYLY